MAAVGPYGIEQFDAPGVLGAYQNVQENRIRLMLAQRQIQALDKKTADESAVQRALATYYGGGSTAQAAPDASGTATTASGASTPTSMPNAPTAAPGARTAADRERLFSSLMAIDPKVASSVMDTMSAMDKSQLEAAARNNLLLAQHATGYKMLPYNQRKAAIQNDAGTLQALGLKPDQLANFDPSDQNLNQIIAQSFDVERMAQFVQPKLVPVTQGGSVTAFNPDGTQQTVYESPTVQGPGGVPYERPPAMKNLPTVQTPEDAAKLPPGSQFRLPDGRIGTVPGGAGGNASGGFQ
jgi:hypothetical protein